MNKINLKTIDAIFDLIEEDDLSSEFKRFKLTHKLAFIRQQTTDSSIQATIDYIMENMLGARNADLAGEVNLLAHYSLLELQSINKALGLPKENTKLSEQTLEAVFASQERSPKLREVYYQLKWKHFKRAEHYEDANFNALTNVADRLQYQEEQANGQ
jgi:hypothetical protein